MAKPASPSTISILRWFEENICVNCAFYRTNSCSPRIKRDWKDAVSEFKEDVYYSIDCFKLQVKNSFKELVDLELSKEERKKFEEELEGKEEM